jgi:two-component system sensor histidine kinase DegS
MSHQLSMSRPPVPLTARLQRAEPRPTGTPASGTPASEGAARRISPDPTAGRRSWIAGPTGAPILAEMDGPRVEADRWTPEDGEHRFDDLHAEAKAALGYAANVVRGIRERYRAAYLAELAHWHQVQDELSRLEGEPAAGSTGTDEAATLAAAETEAREARRRDLRREVDRLTTQLGLHQAELHKLELVVGNLESTWVFLERGDLSLLAESSSPISQHELQMRIVEAQEAERSRIAQEVHDGPAQALSNAIFQVDYIERVLDQDGRLARTELRFLRELLRRELDDVRAFISQLRPPLLEHLGLDGAIRESAESMAAMTGLTIDLELAAPAEALDDTRQTVVLRILQEALQNVRKHAQANRVRVATRADGGEWTLEVADDGRGFDPPAVVARGRRNFGLQFMRERAELIGARLEIRSRPSLGTIVRLSIPMGSKEGRHSDGVHRS